MLYSSLDMEDFKHELKMRRKFQLSEEFVAKLLTSSVEIDKEHGMRDGLEQQHDDDK